MTTIVYILVAILIFGLVVMVDDAGHALADQGIGLGIQLYLGGIGNLLDANNDLHMLLPLLISASWNRK